jgi:crossover junction endodeoxyribonuclease RusA
MEFIVRGAPRSVNASPHSRNLWRDRVAEAARNQLEPNHLLIEEEISIVVLYFYRGQGSLDVDNIGKPLIDALKGVVFRDDVQISELLVRKTSVAESLSLTGASPILTEAFERMSQQRSDFVYIRVDPAPDHSRSP